MKVNFSYVNKFLVWFDVVNLLFTHVVRHWQAQLIFHLLNSFSISNSYGTRYAFGFQSVGADIQVEEKLDGIISNDLYFAQNENNIFQIV